MRTPLFVATFVLSVFATPFAHADDAWMQSQRQWREQRAEALSQPDGWLSLVGLHWLAPGRHSVGKAAGRDIVLSAGPDALGEFELSEQDGVDRVRWYPPKDVVALRYNDAPVGTESMEMGADSSDHPGVITWSGGSVQLIERGGKLGLRVRDAEAPTRTHFQGLAWFEPDQRWEIKARFEAKPAGSTIPIANVLGQLEATPNPGRVVFEIDGNRYTLEALGDPAESLFLIVADRSNGKQTYGAGRFLYTDAVDGGEVMLDFNRMVNPPCAYNAYSTCPLPPPENRLNLAVEAGEMTYQGSH